MEYLGIFRADEMPRNWTKREFYRHDTDGMMMFHFWSGGSVGDKKVKKSRPIKKVKTLEEFMKNIRDNE